MARFHVYPNPNGAGYLLDVQADLLEHAEHACRCPIAAT